MKGRPQGGGLSFFLKNDEEKSGNARSILHEIYV